MSVVTPIVHMNGTSRESLLDVRDAAYRAVDAAMDALCQMAPNGRDYYPEPGRMEQALEQHQRRLRSLASIRDELQEEVNAIYEQVQ